MKMNKLIRLIVLAFALSMPISIWLSLIHIYLNWGNTIAYGRWNYLFNSKLFCNTTVSYNKYEMGLDGNMEEMCIRDRFHIGHPFVASIPSGTKLHLHIFLIRLDARLVERVDAKQVTGNTARLFKEIDQITEMPCVRPIDLNDDIGVPPSICAISVPLSLIHI